MYICDDCEKERGIERRNDHDGRLIMTRCECCLKPTICHFNIKSSKHRGCSYSYVEHIEKLLQNLLENK